MDNVCSETAGLEAARGGEAKANKAKRGLCNLTHHRRSSSLVSDATIEAVMAAGDEKPFKCPRLLVDGCSSPGSTTPAVANTCERTEICDQPTTPSSKHSMAWQTVQPQPAAAEVVAGHQLPLVPGQENTKANEPMLEPLECTLQDMAAQDTQLQQLASVPCGDAMLCSAGQTCQSQPPAAAVLSFPPASVCPPSPATLLLNPNMVPQSPVLHLNSLSLVASRLKSSNGTAAGGVADSSSPLLPATQAVLEATTARVVAAEALAAAAAAGDAVAGQPGSQFAEPWTQQAANCEAAPVACLVSISARAATHIPSATVTLPSAVADAEEQHPAQLVHPTCATVAPKAVAGADLPAAQAGDAKARAALPSWLCSSSAGLEASAAIIRASLLSTTAALARLSQQPLMPAPATVPVPERQRDLGIVVGCPALPALPVHGILPNEVAANPAWVAAPAAQQPTVVTTAPGGCMALGVPAAAAADAVVALASPRGRTHHLFDFGSASAGELRCSVLSSYGAEQCNDASSCSSTPRAKLTAAAADVTVQAAVELLSGSSRPRRRCCWEAVEGEAEEQWGIAAGDMVEVASPPTPTVPTAGAAAATPAAEFVAQQGVKAAEHADVVQLAQQVVAADAAAACACGVVLDAATKRAKQQWQKGGAGFGETGSVGMPDHC